MLEETRLIADAVKRARLTNTDVAFLLAETLSTINPRFDRASFLKACGVEDRTMTSPYYDERIFDPQILALATHWGCDPDDIIDEGKNHYSVVNPRAEFLVLTEDEADYECVVKVGGDTFYLYRVT